MTDPQKIKERAALASIAASALMTLGKLAAGLSSGSLALLSEAGNNLIDVGVTVTTYFALRIAHKPADEDHPFGHGKVEALAALFETGLLFALSFCILFAAINRLNGPPVAIDANRLAFAVLIVSIIVDLVRWQSLRRIARATKSDALAADALNFASDIIGSSLALGGLVAARLGFPQGDAVAAFGVALFIAVAGYRLGRRTVDTLLDTAPKGLTAEVRAIAQAVPGVIGVGSLRLRPVGPDVVGDIGISVPRTLPFERVAAIKDNVQAAIAAAHPDVSVMIATRPIALDTETVLEKVLHVSARRHVPIHHVTVQEIDGKNAVSFDVELDGRMRLAEAHDIVSGLEADVRTELGPDIEVETHIEPMEPNELPGRDADAATLAAVSLALAQRGGETRDIHDVHNVRVRRTPAGLVVNYHCFIDPGLSVDEVHERVDELERKMRADFAEIVRIVGHAEPSQVEIRRRG